MAFDYLAPTAGAAPNTVYTDNPLPLEYALAKRHADHQAAGANAFTFHVTDGRSLAALTQALGQFKQNGRLHDEMRGLTRSPFYQEMQRQGLVDANGVALANFQARLQARPQIEVLLSVGNDHAAVFSMNQHGVAFIDSKGTPCPNDQLDPAQQQSTVRNILSGSWVAIYDKPHDQALVNRSMHFHEGDAVKQQKHANESVDWCLANLERLARTVDADAPALKASQKADRQALVAAIQGQPDPRNRGAVFNLRYRDESQNEAQKQQRQGEVAAAQAVHQTAAQLWRARVPAAAAAAAAAAGAADPDWVTAYIERPPAFSVNEEDVNAFESTRDNGMKNVFKAAEDNSLKLSSTGGTVTYSDRFLRLAEDYATVIARDPATGAYRLPIVIKSINPPSQQAQFVEAFEKVFGQGCLDVTQIAAPAPAAPAVGFGSRS